jgi:hypothetical protein
MVRRARGVGRVLARAVVVVVVYVTFAVGLAFLAAFLDHHGQPEVFTPLVVFDVLTLFAFTFIAPALVLSPRVPRPPDGPPRGGLVPFPLLTPDGVADPVEEPPQAA